MYNESYKGGKSTTISMTLKKFFNSLYFKEKKLYFCTPKNRR